MFKEDIWVDPVKYYFSFGLELDADSDSEESIAVIKELFESKSDSEEEGAPDQENAEPSDEEEPAGTDKSNAGEKYSPSVQPLLEPAELCVKRRLFDSDDGKYFYNIQK